MSDPVNIELRFSISMQALTAIGWRLGLDRDATVKEAQSYFLAACSIAITATHGAHDTHLWDAHEPTEEIN